MVNGAHDSVVYGGCVRVRVMRHAVIVMRQHAYLNNLQKKYLERYSPRKRRKNVAFTFTVFDEKTSHARSPLSSIVTL